MSKNMTRKGLAFGAGLALVGSGLAVVPAQAALTGFISQAPASGFASAWAVEAVDGETFSLQATPAGNVVNANIKFLVEDPDGKITPGAGSTAGKSDTLATGDLLDINTTDDILTFTSAGVADGNYIMYTTTDLVVNDGGDAATDVVALPKDTLVNVYVNSDVVLFASQNALPAGIDTAKANVSAVFVDGGTITFDSDSIADGASEVVALDADDDTVTLTTVGVSNGDYYIWPESAFETDDADVSDVQVALEAAHTQKVTVTNNQFVLAHGSDIDASVDEINGVEVVNFVLVSSITSVRAADNSYVVDSGMSTAGDQPVLELVATDTTTRSVSVTTFVDLFADNEIGATEYASASQTIQFVDQADITATTVLTAPEVGDSTITATVTTSPILNGAQLGNQELIRIVYSRQDGVRKAISAAATQSLVTGSWTATAVSLSASASAIDDWVDADTAIGNANNNTWGITASVTNGDGNGATGTNRDATIDTISVTAAKVATITTTTAHGLRTGDKVAVTVHADDSTVEPAEETTAAAITVTGEKTFTYALSDTAAVTAATDETLVDGTFFTVDTYTAGGGDSIVDRVFAGDYSATAVFETTTNHEYALASTASAKGTLAAVADDVVFTTTASASVQGIEDNGDSADTTNGDLLVKAGTTSLTVTATVLDEDDAPVGAGRNVAITMTNRSANVTVNGLAVDRAQVRQ